MQQDSFTYDSFKYLPAQGLSNMCANFGMPHNKEDQLFETPVAPIGSEYWSAPLNKWMNQRYQCNLQEILRKDFSILSMMRWHLGSNLFLCGGPMDPKTSRRMDGSYPLWYISLLYRTSKVSDVFPKVAAFFNHMAAADDSIRPLRIYLRPHSITRDPELNCLKVLKYRRSLISDSQLVKKWKDFGAYQTRLRSPCRDWYFCLDSKRYPPPKRNWPDYLPEQKKIDLL